MAVGLLLTAAIKLGYPLCEDKIDLPHRSGTVPALPTSGQHGAFLLQELPMGSTQAVRTCLSSEGELKHRGDRDTQVRGAPVSQQLPG